MKTFKLCSLTIVLDEEGVSEEEMVAHEIPLADGLIINKEEAQKDWLLEAVVDREWETFFRNYQEAGEPFMAEVTITKRTNEPASLVCHVSSIFELENHLSVHLEGVLVVKRDDLSDMLLKNLIDEGYEGEELYREYRLRKKNRGQAIQGILTNAYEQVKEKGFYRPDDR
ncbi:YwpF-like family protein [Salisediminibacterium halotolerans]|uniref:YwpF-like protein n=1 Tax=Salisediminibacterium halotolerans TaxID=517425 RepID=A0A1H9RXW0_9BACI|nr:YwpF-like family protein [Salisediminibacterium haloalkalitolerans]SER76729.1 YwpF-like protein [Salisediminibacterium haloalkalitolerans]